MPQEMVAKNTYDIDSVSGASSTSKALKLAVKDALDKAKQTIKQWLYLILRNVEIV